MSEMTDVQFVALVVMGVFILAHAMSEQCNRILVFLIYTLPALLAIIEASRERR